MCGPPRPDHYVTQALDRGMAERVGAVERAEAWIASIGLTGQIEKGSRTPGIPPMR